MQKKYGLFVACIVLTFIAAAISASGELPHVMVINSYYAGNPWVLAHNSALADGLSGQVTLSYFDLDTKRLPPEEHHAKMELALQEYQLRQPDVVVLTDDNAIKLLGDRLVETGTPVVYLGINDNPRRYLTNIHLSTGVLQRPLFRRSVAYLRCIYGDALKRCLILLDSGTTAEAVKEVDFGGRESMNVAGISLDIKLVSKFQEWKQVVIGAEDQGYDVVIMGFYHTLTDETGEHVASDAVAEWTSLQSSLPVYAFAEYAVGKNRAIGGLVYAGRPQGEEAAKLVLRVLSGEGPAGITPVTAEKGRLMFSRHELRRWNIKIPEDGPCKADDVVFVE